MWAEVPSQVVVRMCIRVERRERVWERERQNGGTEHGRAGGKSREPQTSRMLPRTGT
jgi:hypothetical protein